MKYMKKLIAMLLVLSLALISSVAMASMVRTTASVNIRKGPGLDYASRGTASKDSMFVYQGESQIDERGTEWFKVEHGVCEYGWISEKYAYLVTDPGKMPSDTLTAVTGKTYIRSEPNREAHAKGTLQQGATATFLGEVQADERPVDWYYVRSQGIYGWISSKYVVFGSGASGSTSYVVTTGGNQTYLRRYPDPDSDVLATLHDGETADYLDEYEEDYRNVGWYKVRLNGKVGWVSEKYTKLISGVAPAPTPTRYIEMKAGTQTYVRDKASLNGKMLKVMHEGEIAVYLEEKEYDDRRVAWYKVRFDGVVGWVSEKYTEFGDGKPNTTPKSVKKPYVRTTGGMQTYVRAQPNLNGKILATLHDGEYANSVNQDTEHDDRNVKWFKVKFNGVTGWVSEKYTELVD